MPDHVTHMTAESKLYLTYSKARICQGALVSVIPPELKNKHRERSFFLAKECKSRVKFISVVDEKCTCEVLLIHRYCTCEVLLIHRYCTCE